MPVWPKSSYTFGVGLKTAKTEWKLRQKRSDVAVQAESLQALLPRLAATTYWRERGIEAKLDYANFRKRVPLHQHAQLAPLIERMRRGEADVLWPGTCSLFVLSAGTSLGERKHFPVTEEMLAHFRRAVTESLLYYNVRVRHAGVFRGRHLLLGGSTLLTATTAEAGRQAYAGDLSGIVEVNLPRWAERHLYEPGGTVAGITDWDARLDAIVKHTQGRDISLIAGLPNWVLLLAARAIEHARASGRDLSHLQMLWPNLECLVHSGIPVGPFAAELRQALGPEVRLHEVYAAAEGFVACQDTPQPASGLRLMADLGIFFEFLPLSEFDETRLDQLGGKAVPLEDVKTGVDYVVLLTTPAGLVRTLLGDVVRFVSTRPPRILYVGRTDLRLNAFGENVAEKEITDSLVAVCTRHGWQTVNFHVAPHLAADRQSGDRRGHQEWWLELRSGTIETPTGPLISAELDVELQRLNSHYAAKRTAGTLSAPVVRLVMPGVFEHWLRFAGKWGDLHRIPRCCSDRHIANPLTEITHFADRVH